jgi:tetratricopeptide (TPR) repeat protein
MVLTHQGRFKEAERTLREAISADLLEGYDGPWYNAKLNEMRLIYLGQGQLDSSLAWAEKANEVNIRLFPKNIVHNRGNIAYLWGAIGDTAKALKEFEALSQEILTSPDTSAYALVLQGFAIRIAFLSGNPRRGLAEYEKFPVSQLGTWDVYDLAKTYLDLGMQERAVAVLETGVKRYDQDRAFLCMFGVRLHYLLGQAYEESGWKEKAAAQYREFLDIWKNADSGILEIDDAKTRLAKLTSS